MKVAISQHQYNLIQKRQSALSRAAAEYKLIEASLKMSDQSCAREQAALNDAVNAIALDSGAPEDLKFNGFAIEMKNGVLSLILNEPLQELKLVPLDASKE